MYVALQRGLNMFWKISQEVWWTHTVASWKYPVASYWRRQWQLTPVLSPGKSHRQEPGRLQSMESLRVGHDWATSFSLFTFTHWRRKWQPTPVFLPGESQGWGSLVGCRLWGRTVRHDWSDTTAAAVYQWCTILIPLECACSPVSSHLTVHI